MRYDDQAITFHLFCHFMRWRQSDNWSFDCVSSAQTSHSLLHVGQTEVRTFQEKYNKTNGQHNTTDFYDHAALIIQYFHNGVGCQFTWCTREKNYTNKPLWQDFQAFIFVDRSSVFNYIRNDLRWCSRRKYLHAIHIRFNIRLQPNCDARITATTKTSLSHV